MPCTSCREWCSWCSFGVVSKRSNAKSKHPGWILRSFKKLKPRYRESSPQVLDISPVLAVRSQHATSSCRICHGSGLIRSRTVGIPHWSADYQTPLPQKEFTNYYHVSHNLPQIAQQLACKSRLARWRIATSCSVKGGGHHSPSWSSSKPVLQQNGFMWFHGVYVGFLFGGQVKKVQFESES